MCVVCDIRKVKPMNFTSAFGFAALLLFPAAVRAQKSWTLSKCIHYAYANNIAVKKVHLQTETREADRKTALGNFLPNLNATASNDYSFGTSIDQQTNERVRHDFQNVSLGIATSVTLFDGLKNVKTLNRANLDREMSEFDEKATRDDIALSITNAYLQVLYSKALIQIEEAQLQIDRDQLSRVEKQVAAGALPLGAVYDIQSTLAADSQSLTEARNGYDLNRLSLAQLLQLDNTGDFQLADIAFEIPDGVLSRYDPKAIYRKALTSWSEIKSGSLRVQSAQKGIEIAKTAYMPTLDARLGLSSIYSKVLGKKPGVGSAVDTDFLSQLDNNKSYGVGISLAIPLFNRLQTRNRVAKAKIDRLQAELDLQQTENELRQDIEKAYTAAKAAHSAYRAAGKTEMAAHQAFEYASKRFAVGAISSFDFNQAKNKWVKAKADGVRSKYDCFFKLKVLDFYTGVPLN